MKVPKPWSNLSDSKAFGTSLAEHIAPTVPVGKDRVGLHWPLAKAVLDTKQILTVKSNKDLKERVSFRVMAWNQLLET